MFLLVEEPGGGSGVRGHLREDSFLILEPEGGEQGKKR